MDGLNIEESVIAAARDRYEKTRTEKDNAWRFLSASEQLNLISTEITRREDDRKRYVSDEHYMFLGMATMTMLDRSSMELPLVQCKDCECIVVDIGTGRQSHWGFCAGRALEEIEKINNPVQTLKAMDSGADAPVSPPTKLSNCATDEIHLPHAIPGGAYCWGVTEDQLANLIPNPVTSPQNPVDDELVAKMLKAVRTQAPTVMFDPPKVTIEKIDEAHCSTRSLHEPHTYTAIADIEGREIARVEFFCDGSPGGHENDPSRPAFFDAPRFVKRAIPTDEEVEQFNDRTTNELKFGSPETTMQPGAPGSEDGALKYFCGLAIVHPRHRGMAGQGICEGIKEAMPEPTDIFDAVSQKRDGIPAPFEDAPDQPEGMAERRMEDLVRPFPIGCKNPESRAPEDHIGPLTVYVEGRRCDNCFMPVPWTLTEDTPSEKLAKMNADDGGCRLTSSNRADHLGAFTKLKGVDDVDVCESCGVRVRK